MQIRALGLLACATTLAVPVSAAAAPVSLAERPYGNALGDGLGLSLSNGPAPTLGKESCAGPETLFGIDVSYYQGDIDWNAVAASGVKFAWVRVSHSTQFEDPKFQANLTGSRAAGIHTGVYQYFEPLQDPVAQAQLLIDRMGPLQPGDMPPMIDVESTDPAGKAAYTDAIRAWLDHIEAATGVRGFIYTGYYYWNDNVGSDEFIDHPLWIANYNPGCPLIPDYWPAFTIHQYCACGDIPGIAGDVDADTFNGNMAALDGFAVGGQVCGDAKCTFGEDPFNCVTDCPPCGVIGAEGGSIDNGQACLELGGPSEYWRTEPVGQGGSLNWTNVTSYADPSNFAVWHMYFAETGTYSLDVWIEQPFGETKQSVYLVHHAGGETPVPIDQGAQATGWVNLGEFMFNSATDHSVRINDNTGEAEDLELSLVADVLRITRTDLPPAMTTTSDAESGGESGESGAGESGGGSNSGSTGDGSTPTSYDEPTGTGSATGGPSGPGLPENYGEHDGCGCNGTLAGAPGLLVVLGVLRRRRRVGRSGRD
mgnify:CR=1 FL=1